MCIFCTTFSYDHVFSLLQVVVNLLNQHGRESQLYDTFTRTALNEKDAVQSNSIPSGEWLNYRPFDFHQEWCEFFEADSAPCIPSIHLSRWVACGATPPGLQNEGVRPPPRFDEH